MDNYPVTHHGVFWDEGVAYLMQAGPGVNALGLRKKAPFQVSMTKKSGVCSHCIDLNLIQPSPSTWNLFLRLREDPLIKAMVPLPASDKKVYFVEDDRDQLASLLPILLRMGNPLFPAVSPIWMMGRDEIIAKLQETNIQPLVVTQFEAKHSTMITHLVSSSTYLPRKLILVGQSDVPVPINATRIKTEVDPSWRAALDPQPWERIGAEILRRYMRKEEIFEAMK